MRKNLEIIFLLVLVFVTALNPMSVDALNEIKGRGTCLTCNLPTHGPKAGMLTTVLWISALLPTSSAALLQRFLQLLPEPKDSALEKC